MKWNEVSYILNMFDLKKLKYLFYKNMIIFGMSFVVTNTNNEIMMDPIYKLCAIAETIASHPTYIIAKPLAPVPSVLTNSFDPISVNDAIEYFEKTGQNIKLMDENYYQECNTWVRSYFALYNDNYYTIHTNNNLIISVTQTNY